MDFLTVIDKYGVDAAVTFLLITNTFPQVIHVGKWLFERMAPERMAKIKTKEKEEARRDKAAMDNAEFERDLRERDIVAKEQTAKALLLIDAHMQSEKKTIQDQLSLLNTGLTAANQSLAVLLDRTMQRRAGDFPDNKII